MKFLTAYTPTEYKGGYPPYINIYAVDDNNVRITIRGDEGDESYITLPNTIFSEIFNQSLGAL